MSKRGKHPHGVEAAAREWLYKRLRDGEEHDVLAVQADCLASTGFWWTTMVAAARALGVEERIVSEDPPVGWWKLPASKLPPRPEPAKPSKPQCLHRFTTERGTDVSIQGICTRCGQVAWTRLLPQPGAVT